VEYGNGVTVLVGIAGLAALVAILILGMWGVGRVTARLVRLPRFRWFDAERDTVWWKRALVLSASSLVPYVLAVSLFFGVFATQGIAGSGTTAVVDVLEDGAAREAGMLNGDKILEVGDDKVGTFEELRVRVRTRVGPTPIKVERGGRELVLNVTPQSTPKGSVIGVTPQVLMRPATFAESLSRAAKLPFEVVKNSAKALLAITTFREKADLKGPVGITSETGKAGQQGLPALLYFLGILAAYNWPFFAGVHVFDAVTDWVFRTTFYEPQHASDALLRVARLRLALDFALACWVSALLAQVALAFEVPGSVVLALMALPGVWALFPLLWVCGRELDGKPWKMLLPSLVPCLTPLLGLSMAGRLRKAERELRTHAAD
jgi:hypothetical protein